MVKYNKPALTFSQQVDLLIARGLVVNNKKRVEKTLANISYYRLSAYMLPFKECQNGVVIDRFVPDTTWEMVYDLYKFDRKLRLLLFDAIERIEIAIRTQIVNQLSLKYGSHWQDNRSIFKGPITRRRRDGSTFTDDVFADMQQHIKDRLHNDRSEAFIQHYRDTYSEPENPPSWMSVEIMYFSQLSRICDGLKRRADIVGIAKYFSLPPQTFLSWLHALNFTRNLCAHHSRMWNRDMNIVPEKLEFSRNLKWISNPDTAKRNKVYYSVCMIYYLLQTINPRTSFKRRLVDLLEKYSHVINLNSMGFPANWKDDNFWK
mgnify:FL=1